MGNTAPRYVTVPPKAESCSTRYLGLGDSDSVTNIMFLRWVQARRAALASRELFPL